MNIVDIPKWIGIIVIGFGAASSYAVNDYKISENTKKSEVNADGIKNLEKDKEQTIRMEERQKMMQDDMKEIKQLLKEAMR